MISLREAKDLHGATREWIQFLKNNQIVLGASDPKTGKLNYRKQVTVNDLTKFLKTKTDFSDDDIKRAIDTVLVKKSPDNKQAQISNNSSSGERGVSVQSPSQNKPKSLTGPKNIAPVKKPCKDMGDVSDIDYRSVSEALIDNIGAGISEEDVEAILELLFTKAPAPPAATPDPAAEEQKRIEKLNKVKSIIKTTLTDTQRRTLWRVLTDA